MEADRTAPHVKDFKLAMEYKYLIKQVPAGIYLLPERNCMRSIHLYRCSHLLSYLIHILCGRRLHGVIFVRRGLYRDGVFRFVLELPVHYNDYNAHPVVKFTSKMFHPLVYTNGVLDLQVEESLKSWDPETHFIATVLAFIKKIFYVKSFESFSIPVVPNPEALML